jgi:WD40 repeat protein/serine/threonine protein kinase
MSQVPDSESVVLDFLHLYAGDLRVGQPRSLAEYQARFPGHERRIQREFEREHDPGRSPELVPQPPAERRIGPYRILSELGRGGQGAVFLAEDTRIARRVALKVLSSLLESVPQARRQRLRREAEIISRLAHPAIAGIFEAELEGEHPYIALRLVEGLPLSQVIAAAQRERESGITPQPDSAKRLCLPRTPLEVRQTLHFFEQAARAMHAAHEAGIVHRDIKPGNLMVAHDLTPVILDFGLAQDEDSQLGTLTQSGEMFGTPAYMSPEQMQGSRRLDARTDVYSLGVALYECLTLERPFRSDSRAALAQALATREAPDPRRANRALPEDVKVVLETALERDVERRYATALDLAEDLRRIRQYEPIRAKPAGPWLHLRRWTQRHPALAAASLGTLALLSAGLGISQVLLHQLRIESDAKETARQRLEALSMGTTAISMAESDPTPALVLAIDSALAGATYTSLTALYSTLAAVREEHTLLGPMSWIFSLDVSPDSRFAVTADLDRAARVWELATGCDDVVLRGHEDVVLCAKFSPDSRRIVTASADGAARVFDSRTGELLALLLGHEGWVRWAEFSPDGQRIATAGQDGTAKLWDASSGLLLRTFQAHAGVVTCLHFDPRGERIVTTSGYPAIAAARIVGESDRTARVFDVASGELLTTLLGHGGYLHDARFFRDGRRIVTASEDGTARIWDAATGRELASLSTGDEVYCAVPSPDGSHVLAGYRRGVRLWNTRDDSSLELEGHARRPVYCASFRPDGAQVVTGSYDQTARIWDVETGKELITLRRNGHRIRHCAWTPDGERIVTSTELGRSHVWNARGPPGVPLLAGHTAAVTKLVFSPDGARLATSSEDGTVRLWSMARPGELEHVLAGHTGPVRSAEFDRSGARVVTASEDGTARVFTTADGVERRVLRGHAGGVNGAAFSPDGERVLTWSEDHSARIWSAATGEVLLALEGHVAGVLCAAFSPDGTLVATGGDDRKLCLWDAATGTLLQRNEHFRPSLPDQTAIYSLAFSPNGRILATASQDTCVRTFAIPGGRLLHEQIGPTPGSVSFSADGSKLLGVPKWAVQPWIADGSTGRVIRYFGSFPHNANASAAQLSPDAALALTGSDDHTACLWRMSDGAVLARMDGHSGPVLWVGFSPDGKWFATASADTTVRLWPRDPLRAALEHLPRAPGNERTVYGYGPR